MNTDGSASSLLFPVPYLPSVSLFIKLQSSNTIVIDANRAFKKAEHINRCSISGANGIIKLSVPVAGGRGVKQPLKNVRIANNEPWQRIHWGSIYSAYAKSAFFIFYEHKFAPFYQKNYNFLLDFNTELLAVCCEILKFRKLIEKDGNQESNGPIISPLLFQIKMSIPAYQQVFIDKHNFISDLSIVDLIFNCGPESTVYLNRCLSLI
ncbi:MAG: WbqC family protein [Chitinophagales bacterium]|nr:WbqC family protein [Chitinophagales bacterium]